MMNEFEQYNFLLSYIGKGQCTRSSLQNFHSGYFADKIDTYIDYGIIRMVSNEKDDRDDKFELTQQGRKLDRKEISLDELQRSKRS